MMTPLNSVETCHEDLIHAAELDYYGLFLATCSSDNCVKVFDVKNNEHTLVADLRGHQGPVWEVSWAHPRFGNILASCSYDRKVIIWKKTGSSWHKSYEYNGESSVNSIAWAPYEFGMILACASSDGSIFFLTFNPEYNGWDFEKTPNAHSVGCNSISWCPASVSALIANSKSGGKNDSKRFASGGCDNCVKIWTMKAGRWIEETRLESHSDWVRSVAWAPAYGGCKTHIASASQDRHVIIWSSDNMVSWSSVNVLVFDDVAWSVCWSFTGKVLAVTEAANKVSLWREDTDRQWVSICEEYNIS